MVNSSIVASSSGGRPDGINEMYLMTVDVVDGRNFEQIVDILLGILLLSLLLLLSPVQCKLC